MQVYVCVCVCHTPRLGSKSNSFFSLHRYVCICVCVCFSLPPQLLEQLTGKTSPDPDVLTTFIMTYPTFCSSDQLLALIRQRFDVPKPRNTELHDAYMQQNAMHVHFRIYNVLKQLVDKFPHHLQREPDLGDKIVGFLDYCIQSSSKVQKTAQTIQQLVRRTMDSLPSVSTTGKSKRAYTRNLASRKGTRSARRCTATFLSIEPNTFAVYLSLRCQKIYVNLDKAELLDPLYGNTESKKPVLNALRTLSDNTKRWVATELLKQASHAQRCAVLTHFLRITKCCHDMKNYASSFTIHAALAETWWLIADLLPVGCWAGASELPSSVLL
jgi:son of sevenless